MYFLLASVIALVGIVILLAGKKPATGSYHEPIINTDRWIESWEIGLQKTIRKILRFVVVHLVGWYRFVIHDITIHKTMKKKVREILYEHHAEKRKKVSDKSFLNKE